MRTFCAILFISCSLPATAQMPLRSGLEPGKTVPSFHVHAITGPLRDKTVCYVCRNGKRPVVMVLMRDLETHTATLFRGIDKIVDAHRADGLRCFGVLIDNQTARAIPRLQNLSFDSKLSVPLTVATELVCRPESQNIHRDATTTLVLYRQQRVVKTIAFRDDELDAKRIATTLQAVRELVDPDDDP